MKRLTWLLALVFEVGLISSPAPAQLLSLGGSYSSTRLIVRDTLGLSGLNLTCLLLGCHVSSSRFVLSHGELAAVSYDLNATGSLQGLLLCLCGGY